MRMRGVIIVAESIEDVMKKYKGEWIATRVIERDEAGQPLKVSVISHDIDGYRLNEKIKAEKEVCIFYAGPVPREGYVVMF